MKKFLSMALALAMIFSFAAVASAEETLVLGTSADYPPFEFMYLDDAGEMVYGGIDVSAAGYIAEQMGKELVVENMSFDYLLVALAKEDYDIVMAAIEDTPERENAADFSDPYYTDMPPMILIRAADAEQYKTLNDFSGKAVGAQTATTKEGIVTDSMPGAELVSIQNVNDLVNQLVYNKLDAVVLDGAVAANFVAANSDLAIADASAELGAAAPYCVAVAKGDPKGLLPEINAAIAKMLEEKAMDAFVEEANAINDAGNAIEVSVDAPEA